MTRRAGEDSITPGAALRNEGAPESDETGGTRARAADEPDEAGEQSATKFMLLWIGIPLLVIIVGVVLRKLVFAPTP